MIRLSILLRSFTQPRLARPPALLSVLLSCAAALVAYAVLFDQPVFSPRRLAMLAVGGVALAVCLYPLNNSFLFPLLMRLRRTARLGTTAAALLFGLYLVTFSPVPLLQTPLLPVQLTVNVTGKDLPSRGTAVELLGFRADGEFISYDALRQQGSWQRDGSSLSAVEGTPAALNWQGRVRETVLIFRGSPEAGVVSVTWNGKPTRYDLYSATAQEIPVHDLHPPQAWERALVQLSCGMLLGYGVLLLVGLLLAAWPVEPSLEPLFRTEGRAKNLILPLLGAAAFLFATRSFGLWIASDSSNYLSAARHLAAGQGYIALDGDTYTWWPPLYPSLLALLDLLPFSSDLILAWLLHAGLFAANLGLAIALARQMLPSPRLVGLGALLSFFSIALLSSTNSLLSEPLFDLFILAFLICMIRFLRTGDARAGIFSAVFAAMVPLTRYAGVPVVITGCALLLFYPRTVPPARLPVSDHLAIKGMGVRLFQSFTFGLVASLPTALWVGRNYVMSGSFTGPRTPSTVSLAENLRRAWETVSGWYMPGPVTSAVFALALVLLALFLVLRLRRDGAVSARVFARPEFVVPAVFALVYLAQIVISLSLVENAPIGDRLLSPIFLPLTFLLLFAFWQLAPRLSSPWMNWAVSFALVGFLLIAPLSYWAGTLDSRVVTHNGHFSIYSLDGSPLIQRLREMPLDPALPAYSNCPRCMYVFANIHPVVEFNDTPKYRFLPGDRGPFYLVWFDEVPPIDMAYGVTYPLPDVSDILGKPADIQTLAHTAYGAIYLVTP